MQVGDEIMGDAFTRYIADKGVKRVAIMATNNDYGRGAGEIYDTQFKAKGVEIATQEFFPYGGGDFRPQLTKVERTKPEAILLIGQYAEAVIIRRQMKELGLDIQLYTRGDVVSEPFLDLAKDRALGDGIEEATYWDASLESDPEFSEKFGAKYDNKPSLQSYVSYYGIHTFAKAALAAGGGSAKDIQKGLPQVDWTTPLGPVKFDENNQGHTSTYIVTFKDGKISLVEAIDG
jgi:branched-chain amino acid transport system substrate-binding protein